MSADHPPVQSGVRDRKSHLSRWKVAVASRTVHLRRSANNAGLAPRWPCRIRPMGGAHPAVHPPSIERFAPVIWDAASEQRKNARDATSSTLEKLLCGVG